MTNFWHDFLLWLPSINTSKRVKYFLQVPDCQVWNKTTTSPTKPLNHPPCRGSAALVSRKQRGFLPRNLHFRDIHLIFLLLWMRMHSQLSLVPCHELHSPHKTKLCQCRPFLGGKASNPHFTNFSIFSTYQARDAINSGIWTLNWSIKHSQLDTYTA